MCKAVFGDRRPSSSPMPSEQPQESAFSSPPPRSRPDMVLAAIATLILMLAVMAMMITTINRQQISLDDGSVWISADSQQAIARFNIGSGDNDAVLESSAQHTDVIQSGDQLAMLANQDLSTIQPSTLRTTALTRLSRHQTIATGGTIMALLDTDSGDLRVGPISAAQRITNSTPVGNVGKHGRVTVDANGVVYGLHAKDGTVSRWEYHSSSDIMHTKLGSLSQGQSIQADDLTVVDEHAVALQGRTLLTANGSMQLPSQLPTTNSTATPASDRMPNPVLQRPSYDGKPLRNAKGHTLVAVGDAGSMHMIDLHDLRSKPFTLRASGTGAPVNPIVAQGCLHGAWHQPSNNYLRACLPDLTTASPRTLSSISSTSALTFRVNHRSILLNDTMSGDIWHPATGSRVIQPNWKLNDRQQSPRTAKHRNLIRQREFTKQCTEQQGSLTAKDDHHAIRAGNRGLLDVLRNDEQSDCTVLRVSRVDRLSGESGLRIYPVQAGRQLQVDATHARAGTYRFVYGIDAGDHRSSSATLTLTVVGRQNENHAPRQNSNLTNTQVEQDGTVQINALDGFTDDDGDALTLFAATPMNSEAVTVRSRPDGLLTFHAGAQPLGKVEVKVTVSDGKRSTTGLLRFSVVETNTLPAVVDRFAQTAYAKQQTVIDLGPYVHANASQLATLTAVQPPSGASVAISNNGRNGLAPSLLFTAAASGDYAVRFTITQGEHATPGLVRVIVPQSQSNNNSTLTIMDDIATLRNDASALVDVLDNDQADDALAITAVDVSGHPGVKATITEKQQVLITADTMPDAPLTITYRATDGRRADSGHIRVLPANETPYAPVQPRMLHADLAVHGTVSIQILERLGLTDGDITIDPTLKLQRENRQTLAFVTADTIRFQAGATPGSFPVTYTLSNDEGSATGTIVFDVRARDAARQSPPVPKDVTVQVTAGARTNISIPITGIDADGDTVMLSGLGTRSPQLGRITEIGADRLRYEAYPDAQGIDEFTYAVEDWTGRRAQGRIRVAILRSEPDAKLLARNDSAQIRPGDMMTIPVLSNDVLPDDGSGVRIRITDVQGIPSSRVQVDGNKGTVQLTAPQQTGTAYVSYVIQDAFGRTDSAILTIRIDAKTPWTTPTVSDHYVPPTDTIDQRIIQVDVANSIVDALGPQSSLTVSVHSLAAANARKLPGTDSVIEVRLTERSYAIPYMVHDSRHDLTATAFIHVPAYGAFPPSLRPHAPLLRVKSGETIRFDVNDHVRVGAGKHAYVPSQDSVHATKSESGTRLVDSTTLAFTAKRDYSGPASITFAVAETSIASPNAARQSENAATDGNDSTDHPAVTVITLPITVYGHRMPPTFRSTTVDVEAGGSLTINLQSMLKNIESSTASQCRFFAEKTPKAPWHIELDEHGLLHVTLDETAQSGSIIVLPITVDYGNGKLHTALTLRASDSKRMLPRVPSQRLSVKAGERITVDLLQHAYNPFSRSPLRITELAGDKRTVNASLHGSKLTIAPSRGVGAMSTVLHATVSDATNDPARQIQCSIAVTVTDVPSSPLLLPVRNQPRHGEVELQWIAGAAHGSPIDDYEVLYDGHRQSCGTAGFCRIKGLRNGTAYEFRLRAHNDVGWSPYSAPVIATPDTTPTAPDQVRVESGYRQVTVSWNAPDYTGSAPQGYTVTIRGAQTQTVTLPAQTRSHSFTLTHQHAQGIYTASVTAHNRVGKGATATASDSQQPWSDPDAPQLSLRIDPDDPKTVIGTVTLPELHGAGCRTLTVERVKGNFCTNNESFTIPITDKDADTMRVTARLTPEKPHAKATQTTATIQIPPHQTTPEPDPTPASPSASETPSPARKESHYESLG